MHKETVNVFLLVRGSSLIGFLNPVLSYCSSLITGRFQFGLDSGLLLVYNLSVISGLRMIIIFLAQVKFRNEQVSFITRNLIQLCFFFCHAEMYGQRCGTSSCDYVAID